MTVLYCIVYIFVNMIIACIGYLQRKVINAALILWIRFGWLSLHGINAQGIRVNAF